MFALLVPSCWNKFGTSGWQPDGTIRLVTCKLVQTRLIQSWYKSIVTAFCCQLWDNLACYNTSVSELIVRRSCKKSNISVKLVINGEQSVLMLTTWDNANTNCRLWGFYSRVSLNARLLICRIFVTVSNVYTCGLSRCVRRKISSTDGEFNTRYSCEFCTKLKNIGCKL